MINARICLDDEANKILNIFKAKNGFKDKSEAINNFVKTYGKHEIYPEVKDEYIYEMEKGIAQYLKSNPNFKKSITKKELDKLFKK
ncbi:MAG: hypothetical protein WCF78_00755 [archaeon]